MFVILRPCVCSQVQLGLLCSCQITTHGKPSAASLAALDWAIPSLRLSKALSAPFHILQGSAAAPDLTQVALIHAPEWSSFERMGKNRPSSRIITYAEAQDFEHSPIHGELDDSSALTVRQSHPQISAKGLHTSKSNPLDCGGPLFLIYCSDVVGDAMVESKRAAIDPIAPPEQNPSDDETVLSG